MRPPSVDLTAWRKIAYAAPQLSVAMMFNPIYVIQGVYVKHYGFSMASMAAILLASRIFDAVTDPAAGALSDWWKARTGGRKSFVAIGVLIFLVAGFFIYIPPVRPGVAYFTFWLFAFYLGFTIYSVPHLIWGGEIAPESDQKKRVFAFHTAAGYTGLVLFYALPLLPIFETSEITPDTMRLSMIVGAVFMVPALLACLRLVPEGPRLVHQAPGEKAQPKVLSFESLKILAGNRMFVMFIAASCVADLGLLVWYGMIFIYTDIYLGVGELFSPLYLLSFGIGIAVAFGCAHLARWIGAKRTWLTAMACSLAAVLGTSLLSPDNARAAAIFPTFLGTTIGFVCTWTVGRAILAEIVDYSILKDRINLGASYFAIWVFLEKIMIAIGGALGLGLAAYLGFDPEAATQTAAGVFALDVVMSWLPAAILVVSLILIQLIPMNERRHAIVRKRLDQRLARAEKGVA
ncbi:MAG: MFS transporter [Maricaulaceae bacterium]|jgi:Na+/melibiose symporter-like transporter